MREVQSMSHLNVEQIKKLYGQAIATERLMKKYNCGNPDKDNDVIREQYFARLEELQMKLREVLVTDFVLLPKPALIKFLTMCSSYRPREPFVVLGYVSGQYERMYPNVEV